MKRNLYTELLIWKKNKSHKPLLLQGARQVGKTYLIDVFGKKEYENYIYINFEQNIEIHSLFKSNLNPLKIIADLSLYFGKKIEAKDTLIFFDEIQILPEAITSLKYFYEQTPEFHIIAAGSLLGVSVGKESSFPVGKINFKTLYPLSFSEFLLANNESLLIESLTEKEQIESIPKAIHNKLNNYLKLFLFIGGMPEIVQDYINNKDISRVRELQNDILNAYQKDFSKYTNKNQAIKTSEVWNSIPFQLAKENKKFKYNAVRKNARASYYELTIEWLKNAGLIHLAHQINTPKLPLSGYTDNSKFKIYLLDTGLLGAMLNISSDNIVKPNTLYIEYNGLFIENFVATELFKIDEKALFYWTSKHDAEVDFILQIKNNIIPIEVKSGLSKNLKSIRSYESKYNPKLICRTSPRNFYIDNNFINLPLYSVFTFKNLINFKTL
ncbi:MAG TPA: ATP-binding protein [Flavobacteriaceae bacterium]|nr:ATP-binding protein [Flavobacteriaceae bacterium]